MNRAAQVRCSNERIVERAIRLRFVSRLPLLCECDDEHCSELLLLTVSEFEDVRRNHRYVTTEGHTGSGKDATAI